MTEKTREELAKEAFAEAAKELAKIANERPMTREEWEENARRAT
jgi:hypothetical protein